MLDDVEAVLSEPAFLTEVDGESTIAKPVRSGVSKQLTSKP
jgi:hypothetical protein